jgi:O-antigen/teichoic acid export membrane protein
VRWNVTQKHFLCASSPWFESVRGRSPSSEYRFDVGCRGLNTRTAVSRSEYSLDVPFGGTVTMNNLVIYIAYSFDKLLLGRFWGADDLGLYERAYQFIDVPTTNLHSAVGGIAFSALSRVQNGTIRLKNYFLKGYSLVISMTVPVSVFCAFFADDIVLVVLGPKWADAAVIFRLLTPTIFVFGIINPPGWLLQSFGLHGQSLRVALVVAPLVIAACLIGLPYGLKGVELPVKPARDFSSPTWRCFR